MGFSSDLTRLHYFISSSGGVERAALRLNVYPSTLSKILDGREVSAYAKSKVEKAIGPITQPKSPRALQLPESDFIAQIKAFISDCGSLAGAGLRLGLRSSTLEKFLTGK